MRRYLDAAWERAMKVQDVILRAMAKTITWWQGAEIMGISDRSMRRWKRRYKEKLPFALGIGAGWCRGVRAQRSRLSRLGWIGWRRDGRVAPRLTRSALHRTVRGAGW